MHDGTISECAFDWFVDISEVLQPLLSTKIGWHSNFTITVFFAVLASLQMCSAAPHYSRDPRLDQGA